MSKFTLDDLAAIIAARAGAKAESSYTKALLDGGTPRAAKKMGEEAVEVIIAALEDSREALVSESADLLYHLLVLLQSRAIVLDEILSELERRTSRSGLEEKASRKS
jgi:phosphoribosyl-ATP pyrophosphohydrolase